MSLLFHIYYNRIRLIQAITTPYLLLSYREHTNDTLIKAFIDQVYPRNQRPISGDALLRLVRNQDPYTLAGALKWCWCRIPGGIVTWKAYNKFKQEEEAFGSNPPLDSFFRIFPNCVESDNHMRLVVYFFELVMALATHGRANGMGETKLPRLAGTWAFDIRKPNSEEPTSFADGLAAWSHAAEASNHLFFAYLRWLASSQQLGFQISKPLMNLFSQIKGVYPPPPAAVYYSQGIHRLVNVPMVTLTVGKLSANPWVLLRRVAKTIRFDDPSLFYSEDDFNTLFMIFNDPNNIRPKLTQTSCDILEHISKDNSITSDHPLLIRDTWKLSYDLRAKTWSKYYNHAFIDAVTGEIRKPFSNYVYEDSQYEDVMNASIPSQELHGLPYPESPDPHKKHLRPYLNLDEEVTVGKNNKERGGSRISSGLNWDKFAKYGFDRPAGNPAGPAEVFMASKRMSRYTDSLVTAAVSKVAIDDFFVWVWMSTLSEDQTEVRKATFGRSLIVETMLDDDTRRWVVVEEILSPAPEPMKPPYTADEKQPVSLGDKIARRVVSSPAKSAPPKRVKSKKKGLKKKFEEKVVVEEKIERPKRKPVNYSTLDPLAAALNDRLKQPLLDAQTQTYSVEGTQTDLGPTKGSVSIDKDERMAVLPPPLPEKDTNKTDNDNKVERPKSRIPPRELSVGREIPSDSLIATPISPARLNSPLPSSPSDRQRTENNSPVYGNLVGGFSSVSAPLSSAKLNSPLPPSPADIYHDTRASSVNDHQLPISHSRFERTVFEDYGSLSESAVTLPEESSTERKNSDSLALPKSAKISPSVNPQDDDDSNSVYYSPRNLTESEDMHDDLEAEETRQSTPNKSLLNPKSNLSSMSAEAGLADTSQTSQELSQEDDEGASSDVIDDYYNYYSDDVKSVSHSLQALGITASTSTYSADRPFNGESEYSRAATVEPEGFEGNVSGPSPTALLQKPLPPPPGSFEPEDGIPNVSSEQYMPVGDKSINDVTTPDHHPVIVTRAVSGSPASEPPTCSPPLAPSHNSDSRSHMLLELTDQSDFADGLSSIAPKWTKTDYPGTNKRKPEQKRSVKRRPVGGWTNSEPTKDEPLKSVEPLKTAKNASNVSSSSQRVSGTSAASSHAKPFTSNSQGASLDSPGKSENHSSVSNKAQLQEDEVSASDATNMEHSPVLQRDRPSTVSDLRGAPRLSDPVAPVQTQRPASYDNVGYTRPEHPAQAPFTKYHERSGSQSTTSSPNDARLNQYNRNYKGYPQRSAPMNVTRFMDVNSGSSVPPPRRQFLVPRTNRGVSDDSTATSIVGGPAQLPPYGPSRNINSHAGEGDTVLSGLSSGSEDARGPPIGQGYGGYGMHHTNIGRPPAGSMPLRNNAFGSDWSSSQVDFRQQRNNDLLMGDIPIAPKSKFQHTARPSARAGIGAMPRAGPMEAATSISTGPYPIPGGRPQGTGRNSPGGVYPPAGRNNSGGMYGPSGRNSPGGMYGPTGRNSPGGVYGPSGRNSPGGMYGPAGRNSSGGVYGLTGRNSPGSRYGTSGRNSPGGIYGPSGRNSPGGIHGPSGRNSPGGVYGPSGRNSPGGRYASGRNSPGGMYGPSGRNNVGAIYGSQVRNDPRGAYLSNSQGNIYKGSAGYNGANHLQGHHSGRMDLGTGDVSDGNPYSVAQAQSPAIGTAAQFQGKIEPDAMALENKNAVQRVESPIVPPQQPYVMEEELMKPTTGQGTPPVVNTAPAVSSRPNNSGAMDFRQRNRNSAEVPAGNQDAATSWGKKPLPLDPRWVEVKANLEASKAENHGSREFLPAIVENAPQLDDLSNMNGSMNALDGYVQEASRAVKAPSIYTGEHVKLVEVKDTHGAGNVIPEIDGQEVLASRAREGYVDAAYRQRFGDIDANASAGANASLEQVADAPAEQQSIPASVNQRKTTFEHEYYKESYREDYHLPLNPVYDAIERGLYQPPSARQEMPNPLLMKRESRIPQVSQASSVDNRPSMTTSVASVPSSQSLSFLPTPSPEKKKPLKEPAYEVVISANDSSVAEAHKSHRATKSSSSHGRMPSSEGASRFSLLGLVQAAKGHR